MKIMLLQPTKTGSTSANYYLNIMKDHRDLRLRKNDSYDIKICTARNPYDRVLSMVNHFAFCVSEIELVLKSTIKKNINYLPQINYLEYEDIKVDHIIKLENNQELQLNHIANLYDLKTNKYVLKNTRSYNKKKKLETRDIKIINRIYKEDFKYLV